MRAWTRLVGTAVGLALLVGGTVGCQDGRDRQIEALQAQLEGLERENQDLKGRLTSSDSDAGNTKSRALQLQGMIDDLNRQLNEARGQLASAQQTPNTGPKTDGDWTNWGPYAWTSIGEPILFDPGKSIIKASGKSTLQRVVNDIRSRYPGRVVWIIGHTDSDPIRLTAKEWEDNLELSQGRSRSVMRELTSMGLDAKEVIAGGQGEFNPVKPNDSRENKLHNRRVVIVAVTRPPTGTGIGG